MMLLGTYHNNRENQYFNKTLHNFILKVFIIGSTGLYNIRQHFKKINFYFKMQS